MTSSNVQPMLHNFTFVKKIECTLVLVCNHNEFEIFVNIAIRFKILTYSTIFLKKLQI